MLNARNISNLSGAHSPQHALRTDDLDYELPERLIATRPIEGRRDAARMMVVSRSGSSLLEHCRVRDLPAFLRAGDSLVVNTSAVVRARLVGRRSRPGTGGRVEGLFLEELPEHSRWLVKLRSNGRLRVGDRVDLIDAQGQTAPLALVLCEPSDSGEWIVETDPPVDHGAAALTLEQIGRTPLPPYILRARGRQSSVQDELDRSWYETVYADPSPEHRQSVAAPTAGLHFTPELLSRLDEVGVKRHQILLHVGPGTFKPVTAETLSEHIMHQERYEVPPDTLEALRARSSNPSHRFFAIGTTAVRALESLSDPLLGQGGPLSGSTDLMIAPPYVFRHVDGLLTNFHLPRSTLLALVAAMVGLERVKTLYREAVEQEYRFYSYGDCMLILP